MKFPSSIHSIALKRLWDDGLITAKEYKTISTRLIAAEVKERCDIDGD